MVCKIFGVALGGVAAKRNTSNLQTVWDYYIFT
jgi:hypothetical protein